MCKPIRATGSVIGTPGRNSILTGPMAEMEGREKLTKRSRSSPFPLPPSLPLSFQGICGISLSKTFGSEAGPLAWNFSPSPKKDFPPEEIKRAIGFLK